MMMIAVKLSRTKIFLFFFELSQIFFWRNISSNMLIRPGLIAHFTISTTSFAQNVQGWQKFEDLIFLKKYLLFFWPWVNFSRKKRAKNSAVFWPKNGKNSNFRQRRHPNCFTMATNDITGYVRLSKRPTLSDKQLPMLLKVQDWSHLNF